MNTNKNYKYYDEYYFDTSNVLEDPHTFEIPIQYRLYFTTHFY